MHCYLVVYQIRIHFHYYFTWTCRPQTLFQSSKKKKQPKNDSTSIHFFASALVSPKVLHAQVGTLRVNQIVWRHKKQLT